MSVSLRQVLEEAGFDVKNNPDDAKWLLAQEYDWEEIRNDAINLSDECDDYRRYVWEEEEKGNWGYKTFEEWRNENEQN